MTLPIIIFTAFFIVWAWSDHKYAGVDHRLFVPVFVLLEIIDFPAFLLGSAIIILTAIVKHRFRIALGSADIIALVFSLYFIVQLYSHIFPVLIYPVALYIVMYKAKKKYSAGFRAIPYLCLAFAVSLSGIPLYQLFA